MSMSDQKPESPYRSPPTERVEYRVVTNYSAEDAEQKMNDLARQGFRFVPGGMIYNAGAGKCWLLMQRTTTMCR